MPGHARITLTNAPVTALMEYLWLAPYVSPYVKKAWHAVMGSALSAPEAPPSVVLVPPLLDRERKGRSRFAKSSYDRSA